MLQGSVLDTHSSRDEAGGGGGGSGGGSGEGGGGGSRAEPGEG